MAKKKVKKLESKDNPRQKRLTSGGFREAQNGKKTETQIQREIWDVLEAAGWLVLRENQIGVAGRGFQGKHGVPDLMCTLPKSGKTCGVEIKKSKAEYEKWLKQDNPKVKSHQHAIEQRAFGNELRKRNAYYVCIYSKDEAIRLVEELK